MTHGIDDAETATDDAYVFVRAPRCPRCESRDLQVNRSIDNGDGSRTKWTACLECDHRFKVIWE